MQNILSDYLILLLFSGIIFLLISLIQQIKTKWFEFSLKAYQRIILLICGILFILITIYKKNSSSNPLRPKPDTIIVYKDTIIYRDTCNKTKKLTKIHKVIKRLNETESYSGAYKVIRASCKGDSDCPLGTIIEGKDYQFYFGSWSNPECEKTGFGWYITKYGTCGTGKGNGIKGCQWIEIEITE